MTPCMAARTLIIPARNNLFYTSIKGKKWEELLKKDMMQERVWLGLSIWDVLGGVKLYLK